MKIEGNMVGKVTILLLLEFSLPLHRYCTYLRGSLESVGLKLFTEKRKTIAKCYLQQSFEKYRPTYMRAKKIQRRLCETEDFCARGFEGHFIIIFGLYSVASYSRVLDLSSILKGLRNLSYLKLLSFAWLSLCNHKFNWLV